MKAFHVLTFTSLLGLTYQAEEWSYDRETEWPGVCRTGQQQSPINIMTRDAVLDSNGAHIRGPLVFRGYGSVNVSALNNGHTLKWMVAEDRPAPVLSGGPLRGNYTLMQFHLHWLSEHALDGMKYPLEIHFVHIKAGLTLDEALGRPDGLAVIGVIYQVRSGDDSAQALAEIMPVVPSLVLRNGDRSVSSIIDVARLFSPEPQSFYTYHGSLTTPLCQEVVTWIVMDKPSTLSDTQYKLISKVDVGGIDNYRSLQPVNRVVYRSIASCSSILAPSFISFLISLFSCFASNLSAAVGKGVCFVSNVKRKIFGDNVKECIKVHVN